ncbi:MAG: hypothetical protein ACI8Q6_000705 [Granulosicoccus sp.]|jgi:hypothetical protein
MKIAKVSANVPSKAATSSEAAFKKILDTLVAAQTSVDDLLAAVKKMDPVAPASVKDVAKQQKITNGRAAVFKDLAKSAKRGELHTNPAKLGAMIKNLNTDIAAANWIEGGVAGHLDVFFQGQIDDIKEEITRALPKGVFEASFDLNGILTRFGRVQSKQRWTKFSAGRRLLISDCREAAEEQDRQNKIKAMMNDSERRKIKMKDREKIIKTCLANANATPKSVGVLLDAAFAKQDKPSRDKWATYLQLGAGGSYRLNSCGSCFGYKMHTTMSSDSWTANANEAVSIDDNTPDKILSGLLKTTDWKQLHATLEVGSNTKDWPHVFLFAGVLNGDKRWAAVKTALEVDDNWIRKAQAQMTGELVKIKADLESKIKKAKAVYGSNM